MSLINNMLKDLEQRQTVHQTTSAIHLIPLQPKQSLIQRKKKLLLMLFAFFMFLILISALFSHKPTKALMPLLQAEIIKTSDAVNEIDSNWLKASLINGITFQVKDNLTEITFLLDHPALYRLRSDNAHNQLILTIENAKLQAELPTSHFLSTGLQRVSTQMINQDTQFNLFLNPGASIKYINLNNENKNPTLVIGIESAIPPQNQINTKLTKTPAIQSLLSQAYQAALNEAEKGQYQTAMSRLASLLKADPTYQEARTSLAALLMDQGMTLQAKLLIDKGLELFPGYVPFIELKARILASKGKPKEALALLQSVSPPIEDDPEYHAFIAALYEQDNNDLFAIKIYKQLLNLNPNNGNWWFGLGVSLEKLGQSNQALEAYTRAMNEGHLNSTSIVYLQNHLRKLQGEINAKE